LLPPAGKKPRSPKGSTGTERRKKEKRRKGGKQESTGGHSSSRGTSFADADKKDAGEVMQGVGGGGGTLTEQRDCAVHSSMQRVKVVAASTWGACTGPRACHFMDARPLLFISPLHYYHYIIYLN
jgi:hypothetical protein